MRLNHLGILNSDFLIAISIWYCDHLNSHISKTVRKRGVVIETRCPTCSHGEDHENSTVTYSMQIEDGNIIFVEKPYVVLELNIQFRV